MAKTTTLPKSYIRSHWAEITNRTENGEVFYISDRGDMPIAVLMPVKLAQKTLKSRKTSITDHPAVGIFESRTDMVDSVAWVNKIRSAKYKRLYGK